MSDVLQSRPQRLRWPGVRLWSGRYEVADWYQNGILKFFKRTERPNQPYRPDLDWTWHAKQLRASGEQAEEIRRKIEIYHEQEHLWQIEERSHSVSNLCFKFFKKLGRVLAVIFLEPF